MITWTKTMELKEMDSEQWVSENTLCHLFVSRTKNRYCMSIAGVMIHKITCDSIESAKFLAVSTYHNMLNDELLKIK